MGEGTINTNFQKVSASRGARSPADLITTWRENARRYWNASEKPRDDDENQLLEGRGDAMSMALCQPQPFIMPVTHGSDTSKRERSVDDPFPTITGANRGELAVVEPFVLQQQSGGVARPVSQPLPTIATDGAIAVVESFLLNQSHGQRVHDVDQPLPTITTAKGGELAVVSAEVRAVGEPFIVPPRGFSQHDKVDSIDRPLRTIVAASGHNFAVVEPFLVPYYTERTEEQHARTRSVDDPLPTITASGSGKVAVVEPFLIPHYGERPGQPPRTHSVDEPVPTIPATGDGKFEVVQSFIVSAGGPKVGPISTEQPMNTVLTRDHMALVEPFIVEYHSEKAGDPARVRSVDEPLPTASTENRFALAEPSFIASYYGTQNISPVSAPLPTVTAKDRFALVMPVVNGKALDIRLRMLKPHELARAMSFGDDYKFAGNQGEKVRQIGNAWPCRLGAALITALVEGYAAKKPTKLEAIA